MSGRIYDDAIYRFAEAPSHFWAATAGDGGDFSGQGLQSDIDVDVAIVGGGYTGLFAAHRLATRHHLSCAVLEAGSVIGWGASGMNGGFVSMGGAHLSLADMLARVGEAETRRYWQSQITAIDELGSFIAENSIPCERTGDGNLCVAHSLRAALALSEEARILRDRFGVAATFMDAETFRREIHRGPETHGAVHVQPGFAVHPMRLVRGVAAAACRAGARIHTATEIIEWRREGHRHRLVTKGGATVRADRIIFATNAYAPAGLSSSIRYRVMPAISSILVTEPYRETELAARGLLSETPVYNGRHILSYYRRLPDGRILFGGRGDTAGTDVAAARQSAVLLKTLKRVLPDFADARIAFAWRGLVALTARRTLALGVDPDDPSLAFAYGCQGSGIATMSWAGRQVADLVAGTASTNDTPALFRERPRSLPPSPRLLRWGLRAAYTLYGIRDAIDS